MKNKIILFYLALLTNLFAQQEFSEGPYGINYFDIAGPFTLEDLNSSSYGDVNFDDNINIQDIILVIGHILDTNNLDTNQINAADINNDNIIDILDIVQLANVVLGAAPQPSGWDFESNWNGQESYIFIHLQSSAPYSTSLWNSTTKSELLSSSPNNVHYFFLSSNASSAEDVSQMKDQFDEIINGLPLLYQGYWRDHLHFIPTRSLDLDNWLAQALNGKKALAIDSFQKIREIGYLGNPANFTGTYMHYLAHEAEYFKYELNTFSDTGIEYDEIIVFDQDVYTGGWAASTSQLINLPSDAQLSQYDKMEVELLRGCPDSNGNYSDAGCDDYDRIARMFICDEDGTNCNEIARWITPFDRQPHHLTDISSFMSMIQPGGNKIVKFQESGWPNSLLTMKFRFYHNDTQEYVTTPKEYTKMWVGTFPFNPDFDANREPIVFNVPENASKVEFVSYITGHGWSCGGTFQCAEFCNSQHMLSLNGGLHDFQIAFPNGDDNDYCIQPEAMLDGTIPNQYGTWGYGRAGWCPGQDVRPWITDITDYVSIGDENVMEYSACRVSWDGSCATPPVCPGGDCYCPEIAMTSYIIVWY